MLRSCYRTKARFYESDQIEDTILWYWSGDETPFLPVPTAIVSHNWLDVKDRVDLGQVGEVDGAKRVYTKGFPQVGMIPSNYCGTDLDFLGQGIRPTTPPPLNNFGQLACCGSLDDHVDLSVDLDVNFLAGFDYFWAGMGSRYRASELAYSVLLATIQGGGQTFPWQVDLWHENFNSSGTNDFLSDFQICDFAGYAPQFAYATVMNPDLPLYRLVIENDVTFTATEDLPDPTAGFARGLVVSDMYGMVIYYGQFEMDYYFVFAGDLLTLALLWFATYDYV